MKLIALRNFSNNCGIEIEKPENHPKEVHKGAVFTINGDVPFEKLNATDKRLVMELQHANCVGDGNNKDVIEAVRKELESEGKRLERAKPAPAPAK